MAAPTDDELHERLRELCFAMPEVSERLSHGSPSFFIREKRVLCSFHPGGRPVQREFGIHGPYVLFVGELSVRKNVIHLLDAWAGMPEEAHEAATKELDRLARMHPSAAEYTGSRTYID